ncbi:MAG TPA: histidine phosphatase family protein [Terriglobia bacterium]|jgi:probable phosphoglycerate mutase
MSQELREARVRENQPVELVLVRHAEPDWDRAFETASDPGLTSFGNGQALRVAAYLKERPLAALYCSPLQRTRETAGVIAKEQDLTPQIVDGLEEIRVPVLQYASQTEVDAYFAAAARRPLKEHWAGYPGGESFHEFHGRVTAAIESVLAHYGVHPQTKGEFTVWSAPARAHTLRIGIVGHGGTNSVLLTHLLGIPSVPWEWFRFETPLAAVSNIALRAISGDGYVWSLQRFGWRAE